jgi:FkbM family methyltransferase
MEKHYGEVHFQFDDEIVDGHSASVIMNLEDTLRERFWNIEKNDIVIDIGANFGSYTLWALARGAEFVYSFEPGEGFFRSLRNNIKLNKWGDKCCLSRNAIWDTNGVLYYSQQKMGMSGKTPIDAITLDTFFKERVATEIDWIKVDVEGGEMNALKGAYNTIKKFRPTMLVECHKSINPDIEDEILKYIQNTINRKLNQVEIVANPDSPSTDTSYIFIKP